MLAAQTNFGNWMVAIIFMSVTLVGLLGNFSLLCHYLLLYYNTRRVRTADFILMHLTVSNSLILLSKAVPQTMTAFGLKHFIHSYGCRLLLYVQKVTRSVSIGTTCLLSVFQAITISPRHSCWKDLKAKAAQYVTGYISFCWILNMFANLIFPMYISYVSSKWSMKNLTQKRDLGYCYAIEHEKVSGLIYTVLIVFPEVSFSVLIVWASGFMVSFLYRHKQRVQYLHRNNISSRPSAESRATQRILVLVSCFLCFHTLSSCFHGCSSLFHNHSEWLMPSAALLSVCFPSLSPLLLLNHDLTVARLATVCIRNMR